MRLITLFLTTLALVTLTGCTTALSPTSPPPLSQSLTDEKALYAAEAAYFGVQSAVSTALDSGVLIAGSEKAVKIADQLVIGKAVLDQARAAQRAGETQQVGQLVGSALLIFGDIQSLLK